MNNQSTQQTGILIIGGGIAGLSLALRLAAKHHVTVISKTYFQESNTWWAQGGIAAVVDEQSDSFEQHVQDTLIAGAGLCNETVVRRVVEAGPALITDLLAWGVEFTTVDGVYDLGREGGHQARRILHVGDLTGAQIGNVLLEQAKKHPSITLVEQQMAVDLITERSDRYPFQRRCLGAYMLDVRSNAIHPWFANVTVLATGGSGKVYLYTSNPDVATGDGLAMAYRAGCHIVNMEFTQFHPTCLYHSEAKNFLISEAVRGEGAVLLTKAGKRFMPDIHPMAELAPRDIVARAIDAQLKKTGDDYVLLDISHKPPQEIEARFPNLVAACLKYGYDMRHGPIPVVPAAHYQCGGVLTDQHARTEIAGLYAVGEVAFTGLHGANRLASNSLLESLAWSAFAAEDILLHWSDASLSNLKSASYQWVYGNAVNPDEEAIVAHHWDEVRRTMSNFVGIVRTNKRLERAERRLRLLADEVLEYYWGVIPNKNLLELRNLVQVAWLIVQSAKKRKESRGLHYTLDYPQTDQQARDTYLDPVGGYP